MRMFVSAALLLGLAATLPAQPTKTTVTKPTTPHDDSKPNSSAVPDVYAIPGDFERILVLRFKHKADLLTGLGEMVEKEAIKNAVILSGIGSVRNYHIHYVSNRDFPSENIYVKDPTEPADITSVNGYIINGKIHAHMSLANDRAAFGGHLEEGTSVFTFAVLTVGVLTDEADLSRVDDKTLR